MAKLLYPVFKRSAPYVLRVYSDNLNGVLLTQVAYDELRLSMSTGDYHTHRAHTVKLSSVRGDERYKVLHFYAEDYKQRCNAGWAPQEAEALSWDHVSVDTLKRWEDYK